jgi:hypothetical protein
MDHYYRIVYGFTGQLARLLVCYCVSTCIIKQPLSFSLQIKGHTTNVRRVFSGSKVHDTYAKQSTAVILISWYTHALTKMSTIKSANFEREGSKTNVVWTK